MERGCEADQPHLASVARGFAVLAPREAYRVFQNPLEDTVEFLPFLAEVGLADFFQLAEQMRQRRLPFTPCRRGARDPLPIPLSGTS